MGARKLLRYVCTLRNPDQGGGMVRESFCEDEARAQAFAKANDSYGMGQYYCIGRLTHGARRRNKENVVELPEIVSDLDLKNIKEDRETVLKTLAALPCPPTEIRNSGNGLHAIWKLKEPLAGDDIERGEKIMKGLVPILASDRLPTHRAALLRVPGTTNSKGGFNKPCYVLPECSDPNRIYDITDMEAMIELIERPLLNLIPRDAPAAPAGSEIVDVELPKGPVDVDDLLAKMRYGGGEHCIHLVQRTVTASLTARGFPIEEAVERVLKRTQQVVEDDDRCAGWDWSDTNKNGQKGERYKLTELCLGIVTKAMKENGEDLGHTLPVDAQIKWNAVLADGKRPVVCYGNGGAIIVKGYQWENLKKEHDAKAFDGILTEDGAILLKPLKLSDFENLPPREFLYGSRIQRKKLSCTVAKGGTGKTTKKVVEAAAMATCRDLLGIQPPARLKVWLHSGEDDLIELKRKVLATCQHYEVPIEEIDGWLYLTSFEEIPLKVANGYHELKLDSVLIGRIKKTILDNEIDVFIADPLVTLHGAPENDNGKMDQVMRILIGIAITCDCGVDISHHIRKAAGSSGEASADDGRGASSIDDAVRYMEVLNVMSESDGAQFGFDEFERLSYFRSDQGKANTAPAAKRAHWFKLENVEIPNGDNVGVVIPWERPDEGSRDVHVAADAMFLKVLDKFTMRGIGVSHNKSNKYAPTLFADDPEAKRAKIGKKALAAAMHRLLDAGMIESVDRGKPSRPIWELRRKMPKREAA